MTKSNSNNQKSRETAFVDLQNARYDDQRTIMKEIIDAAHCPFCSENLKKYHKQPIVAEGEYWLVTPNQWPYNHTRVHLLLILKEHAESLGELTPQAGAELVSLSAQLCEKYAVKGGGLALRFGDTRYSAGTVKHLHVQFIVPDIESPEFEPVRIKIGSDPQKNNHR
jgi:diadenosine tetraphosphate (Ap4A) HIT family hydrolase